MRRRFSAGLWLAALFTLVNIGGGVYAGLMGEIRHAGLHGVLALAGVYVTWLLLARRRASAAVEGGVASEGPPRELASRLSNLEQSLDAIAVEVERVGEGQRRMTQMVAEQGERDTEAT